MGKNAEILYASCKEEKYIGKIFRGLPHGYGVKTWKDGRKYQGNWVKGRMQGNVEMIYPEGDSFTGEFKNGVPWGLGIK